MNMTALRQEMQRQIEVLPEEILREIADFAAFVLARRKQVGVLRDWMDGEWQDYALQQFLRESDEVTYTLEDAQEVYHR